MWKSWCKKIAAAQRQMDTFQHFLASSERWGKALWWILSLLTHGKCEYHLPVWYWWQVLRWPEDLGALNVLTVKCADCSGTQKMSPCDVPDRTQDSHRHSRRFCDAIGCLLHKPLCSVPMPTRLTSKHAEGRGGARCSICEGRQGFKRDSLWFSN